MRKASLKHLMFKTVFLLALGSGKRRSEIHAWLFKNIRHQENWSQVSFYPSPMFLSKNQLAKDSPASVAPVVIPSLAPSLDKELKEDRSFCPVRALRYYLDRTLCPSGRALRKILSRPLSSLGLNKQCSCATKCPMRSPTSCFKSRPMMSRLLRLPRPFKEGYPWSKFSRPVIGRPTIPLLSSI